MIDRELPEPQLLVCHQKTANGNWSSLDKVLWKRSIRRRMTQDSEPFYCDHCSRSLTLGEGRFYVVRIDALADPTPPRIAEKDQELEEIRRQISALFETLKDQSEQEVMDQVIKRIVLYLCNACYSRWIENPTNK